MTSRSSPAGATHPAPPAGDCDHLFPQYTAHQCIECRWRLEAYRTVIRQETSRDQ